MYIGREERGTRMILGNGSADPMYPPNNETLQNTITFRGEDHNLGLPFNPDGENTGYTLTSRLTLLHRPQSR